LVLESWNAEKQLALGEKQVLLLLFWYMLFADGCAEAEFRKAAEHLSGDIGTARVVAQILGKLLLAAVWSYEARLNCHPRHDGKPYLTTALSAG